MYGAQTDRQTVNRINSFENDVEMYGAQTCWGFYVSPKTFENDVEMYGAQTESCMFR